MPRLPLIAFFQPHPSSNRHTPQSGQQCNQGHSPQCHRLSQHPQHHSQCHPLQLHPRLPCQQYHHSTSVIPLVAGAQCPITIQPLHNHPYLIGYPLGLWPPYQQYYAGPQGHGQEDSEMAKPDKFTGWDPSKLCPFIVSCIIAFDSQPCKFATNLQWVSYATSYLSDISMLWWQPILVTYSEPLIQGTWGEFIDQL